MNIMKSQMEDKISYEFNHPRLRSFAKRFGKAYIDLAAHAAFPLALTPELLYCLRENFQPNCNWLAVADILLSLCDPVGYQLYELEGKMRSQLLVYLKNTFGQNRLYNLSDFMVAYIQGKLKSDRQADRDLGANPQWTALAYVRSKQAIQDIAKALEKAIDRNNFSELVKLTSFIESFADCEALLQELNFQPLLILSRAWNAKARGDEEEAAKQFEKLKQSNKKSERLQKFNFEVITVDRLGKIINRKHKEARYFTENLRNGVTLDMVAIPGGEFLMGAPQDEKGSYGNERPQHKVTVQPFFMGKFPVTQAQWREVANLPKVDRDLKPNPSNFKGDNRPVEWVSWYDAVEFCQRLSEATGREYRLPSEAEWEYACRAGTTTPFHFGETITSKLANYRVSEIYAGESVGKYREGTTDVGSFPPNAFGLYDMYGNVFEWCADAWHGNYSGAPNDGSAWTKGGNDNRSLLRGGSWVNNPDNCRSAFRYNYVTARRGDYKVNFGFRVVCVGGRTK